MQQYRSLLWCLLAGLGTATRRLRPPPGPTQAGAALGRAFELLHLVMLLQLDVASRGPGHLAVCGDLLFGVTPSQWGWSWKKGRPSALMRAGGSRPAAADNNLISNRGP